MICSIILIVFLFSNRAFQHWFVLPVFACGVVALIEGIDWIRSKFNVFDPVGLLGLIGFYLFFMAPLLHVYWDHYVRTVAAPEDWRDWLGWMACLNFFGIILYRLVRRISFRRSRGLVRSVWCLAPAQSRLYIPIALGITLVSQALVYAQFGGVAGYVAAFSEQSGSFDGMGWIFMISESFPILALIGYAMLSRTRPRLRTVLTIAVVIVMFLALKILFGGLRGSRGNTVYALIWAVGIIHLCVRRMPRKAILAGLAFVVAFAYMYGFYKSFGWEGVGNVFDSQARGQMEQRGNRSMRTVALGDFGRSDIQAFLLFRLLDDSSGEPIELAKGRTYLGSAALFVPGSLYPNRPPTKVKEGTEALYGGDSFYGSGMRATYAYGMAGEAMLNVGVIGVILSFVGLGLLVGWVKRFADSLLSTDPRLFLVPFLVTLCLILPLWDSDIILFYLVKNGLVPIAAVLMCSKSLVAVDAMPTSQAIRA